MLVKFFSSWYSVLHELTYVEGLETLWDLYDRNVQVKKLLVCKVGLPHCIKHREERRVPHVKDSTLHCIMRLSLHSVLLNLTNPRAA